MRCIVNFILMLFLFFASCTNKNTQKTPDTSKIHTTLSAYGFYSNTLHELQTNKGVMPYSIVQQFRFNQLYSSYYYYIPDSLSIAYRDESFLDAPIGSCLIKHVFNVQDADTIYTETQVLLRSSSGWLPANYIWNKEQNEATLFTSLSPINSTSYNRVNHMVYPISSCNSCHKQANTIVPIAFSVKQLNKTILYENKLRNQLDRWSVLKRMHGLSCPATSPMLVSMYDTNATSERKIISYLDAQCAFCHNSTDANTNLNLSYIYDDTLFVDRLRSYGLSKHVKYENMPILSPLHPSNSSLYSAAANPQHGISHVHKDAYRDTSGVYQLYHWIQELSLSKASENVKPQQCTINSKQ